MIPTNPGPLRDEIELLRMVLLTRPEDPAGALHEGELPQMQTGRVSLTSREASTDNGPAILVEASRPLEFRPKSTGLREVVVPDAARRECELATEFLADLLTIASRSEWRLSSPSPCIYFRGTAALSAEWLNSRSGIHYPSNADRLVTAWASTHLAALPVEQVTDRRDGVALLSDAISSSTPVGAYIDLMRLFERAFKRAAGDELSMLLHRFLEPALGYTSEETKSWMDTRGKALHADVRTDLTRSSDVRRYVPRMQQAAFDVLLNKLEWRSEDLQRTDSHLLAAGTTGASGEDLFLTRGQGFVTRSEILDPFAVYPRNLKAMLREPPGPDYWPQEYDLSGEIQGGSLSPISEGDRPEPV